MKYIVDRIESGYAVCYDSNKNFIDIPLKDIPFDVAEGSSFSFDGKYILENDSRDNLLERINKLKEKVWKKE